LLLGANATFWSVVQVQEMYALGMLGAVAVMGLALRLEAGYGPRLWWGLAFLYGVCLANRLDLLLWAPGLLWLALGRSQRSPAVSYWAGACFLIFPAFMVMSGSNVPIILLIAGSALWLAPSAGRWRWLGISSVFAGLGLSLYLYLPVRSGTAPYLDWNHPSVLANFLESLLRSRYGGTLDLLSKNYAPGELFGANAVLYGRHLWENFSVVGLALAAWGFWACVRQSPRRGLGMSACWWWSGPVFLFMANMPPNPHAAAIVEPHYLLSDLILAFWAAEGMGRLNDLPVVLPSGKTAEGMGRLNDLPVVLPSGKTTEGMGCLPELRLAHLQARVLGGALCLLLAGVPAVSGRWQQLDRREHLFSYDYAKNVLRCVPPGGTVVAKKDVQLYTLWHYQQVQGWRRDVHVVAQGLAGSAWYQQDMRRSAPALFVGPLRDARDWRKFLSMNPPAFATMDCELPDELLAAVRPRGLLNSWASPAGEDPDRAEALWPLMWRRGSYDYEAQPDFFTSDLISNYAQASYQRGRRLYGAGAGRMAICSADACGISDTAGAGDAARAAFLAAWAWQWSFPEPSNFLGFMAFNQGAYEQAESFYSWTARLNLATAELAEKYHSLPELKANIKRSAADAWMQLGVVAERRQNPAAAESYYQRSLALRPSAQTHYNLAVLFWGRDMARAESELRQALRLEPGHPEADKYLRMLLARRP
jgi:tetratricopeptide (TPR) repeat protein